MSKTHVIDGVAYVEVERVAEVGEKVLVVEAFVFGDVGGVHTIKNVNLARGEYVTDKAPQMYFKRCVVLEPVEDSHTIADLIANLARRVSSLEQQLRDTQGNCEKLAEELADVKYNAKKHIERITCDIITLDERSQVLNAINKFYEEGSR